MANRKLRRRLDKSRINDDKARETAKLKNIKETQKYLEDLELKQIFTCIGVTLNEYVKFVTKSSLVDANGESQDKPIVERAGAVLLAISSRLGQDSLLNSKRLRDLYGVKEAPEPVEPLPEGETPEVITDVVTEETPEETDGEDVQEEE